MKTKKIYVVFLLLVLLLTKFNVKERLVAKDNLDWEDFKIDMYNDTSYIKSI